MEKLSCKDLMVGDLVYYGDYRPNMGGDYDVIFTEKQLTLEDFKFFADNDWNEYDFDEFLKPIPLTPEILDKNGFEKVKHYYPYPTYEFRGIERCVVMVAFPKGSNKTKLEKPFVEIDSEQYWIAHVDTEYVHELQHALKLCKIDKEIEL